MNKVEMADRLAARTGMSKAGEAFVVPIMRCGGAHLMPASIPSEFWTPCSDGRFSASQ